jgi:uncharacterized protein YidB (DUF937 family)
MGLFHGIMAAVNNPNLQANTNQLGSIINTAQQLSNSLGVDEQTVNTAMSVVGNYTKSALQQKRAEEGEEAAKSIVNQFSGLTPSPEAINALFSSTQVSEMMNLISQKTGLDVSIISNILPQLVPMVLQFLNSGSNVLNSAGGNPVLNSFLDADGDGDVDIADAMQMGKRFLG